MNRFQPWIFLNDLGNLQFVKNCKGKSMLKNSISSQREEKLVVISTGLMLLVGGENLLLYLRFHWCSAPALKWLGQFPVQERFLSLSLNREKERKEESEVFQPSPTLGTPRSLFSQVLPLPARLLCPWDFPSKSTRVDTSQGGISPGDIPDPGIEPESQTLYWLSHLNRENPC